jgi:integrase
LLFLYRRVLEVDLSWLDGVVRAKKPARLPVVLTVEEVAAVLARLDGVYWLIAGLLYGSGLRLMECLRLRVKDVDLRGQQVTVRSGKGDKDRVTMLAAAVIAPLEQHLARRREQHRCDCSGGAGFVYLPDALHRKYPNAGRAWAWQFVFAADTTSCSAAAIARFVGTCTNDRSSARFKLPSVAPASRSPRPATRSAIASQRICYSAGKTSARFRSCWATATSARR